MPKQTLISKHNKLFLQLCNKLGSWIRQVVKQTGSSSYIVKLVKKTMQLSIDHFKATSKKPIKDQKELFYVKMATLEEV